MKPIRHAALLGVIVMLLTACQGLPPRSVEPVVPEPPPKLPFAEPPPGPREFNADLIYSYLVGEIGAHRGELSLAFQHYMHVADMAQDAYAAERATRIAVYLGDMPAAMLAAQRWVALAPNAQDARMSLALLRERGGDRAGALLELEALLKISSAMRQDGYLQIARVLAKDNAVELHGLMVDLVAAHSEDARANFGLAVVAMAVKAYDEAEQSLQAALQLKPGWVDAEVLLARVRSARGDTQAAIDGLAEALRGQPDSTVLRTARARLLVDTGAHGEALKEFRRLHQQVPQDMDYLYAVAMLAMHESRWDEARQSWQTLRGEEGERHNEASYFLAQVEEREGHLDLAAGLYGSITEGPLVMDAGLRLAGVEVRQGKLAAARARLRSLRLTVPERAVDAYLMEARLLREAGHPEQARQLLNDAVAAQPDNIELRYGRAMQAARQDDLQTLEQDLQYVLAQDPDHVDALNALGYTLADRTDRYAEAYEYISRAYRLAPENPAILDSLGWVHYRLGDYAKAILYLRQALDVMPDAEIAAHLGEVLWVSGDAAGAREVWRKALGSAPDSPELREVMKRFE